ncbi:LacI family DNA-binding transcriptional regulator [Cupriavidus pauculus]|uniref:LacI family transcriptional regulator n=1 Tax=Cupriavidus pauculus TaxID=82633 RepID=A0A2N5CDV5_9BURK|nr:LacI family DNA-binding transcriptional regulator [Cupriavidus pauculus]PLQ00378.1 LacI family transcriptional regulator [Cupriavidus pauculus]
MPDSLGTKPPPFVGQVSMKEVARLAGVSPMTVSRALSTPHLVKPETLEQVQSVIRAVGYVPNRVAGSLSSRRTSLVGLIVPSLRNALYAETIQGISDVLQRHGLHLMISDSGYCLEREEALISAYLAQRPCGLILHNTVHTEAARQMLQGAGVPCVETGNLAPHPVDMTVSYSNRAAGRAMAEHLVSRGYQRFGFASLRIGDNERLRERRDGFFEGLRAAGIAIDPAMVLEVGEGLESGSQAFAELIGRDASVQALFLAGDVLAAGAIFECARRGLRVPQDIAIAGSDDNDLMQQMIPPITTVRFPRYRIGVRSAELIVGRLGDETLQPASEDLGFEVVPRGST